MNLTDKQIEVLLNAIEQIAKAAQPSGNAEDSQDGQSLWYEKEYQKTKLKEIFQNTP